MLPQTGHITADHVSAFAFAFVQDIQFGYKPFTPVVYLKPVRRSDEPVPREELYGPAPGVVACHLSAPITVANQDYGPIAAHHPKTIET